MTHKALQYDLALSPCRMASLPLTLPSSVQPYMPSYYHLNKPGLSWPQGSYILAVPPARPTLPRLVLCIPYPPLECPALRTVPDHVNKNALTLQPLTGPVSSMTWITVWNTVFTFPPLCFPLSSQNVSRLGTVLFADLSSYREPGAWKLPNNVGERPNCMLQEITSSF